MPDIQERFGFPNETAAENFAQTLRLNNFVCEVQPEVGGTWLVRAYPADFGAVEPASNPKDPEGPPASPGPEPTSTGVQGLLDFIAKFESGGNYNAYFRHAKNQNAPQLTGMKLKNVLQWQRNYVRNGSPSSAAGKYQIIIATMQSLITKMELSEDLRYSADTQESMGRALLRGRGLNDFRSGTISADTFGNRVAMEWAGMPVLSAIKGSKGFTLKPGQSYYAGDGLNKALAGVDSFRRAVEGAKT